MATKPDGPRRPSAEEMALFDRAMRDARRLAPKKQQAQRRTADRPRPRPGVEMPQQPPKPRPTASQTPAPAPEPLRRPYVVERRASVPGLDRRTAERLARGQLPIEARLDLHGHRQTSAYQALESFVLASARAGRRCLLVVTGKGRGVDDVPWSAAEEAPGIIRRNLPRWLSQPPLAEMVLAIRPALPQHGGEGAFYVLLRRQRR